MDPERFLPDPFLISKSVGKEGRHAGTKPWYRYLHTVNNQKPVWTLEYSITWNVHIFTTSKQKAGYVEFVFTKGKNHSGFVEASQCCGSGSTRSTCFWASWIRIRFYQSEVWTRIQILLSTSKKRKKNLDSFCFVTSFWLFIFENDGHVPSKSNKQKTVLKKLVFCWHIEGQWRK